MLEYIKKFRLGKPSSSSETQISTPLSEDVIAPVLSPADEEFLRSVLDDASADNRYVLFEGTPLATSSGADTPAVAEAAQDAEKPELEEDGNAEEKKHKNDNKEGLKDVLSTRWEELRHSLSVTAEKLLKSKPPAEGKVKEKEEIIATEEMNGKEKKTEFESEEDVLTAALDQLNLTAKDGRVFSLSAETKIILYRFTQILKDIINGVPTAYDDLTSLLDTSSKDLEKTFKNLPSFLQRFIKALPTKLSNNLAPELLHAAAVAAPALSSEGATFPGLKEIIAKPGLLIGLLRAAMNVLKTRFPAVLGANMALSMGLFVVLLILWYCHKRGREVRLAGEDNTRVAAEAEEEALLAPGGSRVEVDLQGDATL